ncbi:MAG: peptidoglycan-associated lipoprotein Pal [Burkholderiales bacterium]|nr:peptidoglycan-associated lipoprotein Pal [Burkholderiales bacterium]
MKLLWKLAATVTAALVLAGCSSTPENTSPVEDRTAATGAATGGNPGASTSGVSTGATTAGTAIQGNNAGSAAAGAGATDPALRDPRSPLSRREIFYDFDSFVVKDEYKPLLEAHAAYLKRNRSARLTVEGNTDDRGSREYNLALGQKRAESVKRVLALLGVSEAQVETVSFGEEKPRNPAASEPAWSENRRCDLRYAGE